MTNDDEREALRTRIAAHVARETGGAVGVRALEPLAGGACQDNWRVELELAAGDIVYVRPPSTPAAQPAVSAA